MITDLTEQEILELRKSLKTQYPIRINNTKFGTIKEFIYKIDFHMSDKMPQEVIIQQFVDIECKFVLFGKILPLECSLHIQEEAENDNQDRLNYYIKHKKEIENEFSHNMSQFYKDLNYDQKIKYCERELK